jgi:integrase
MAWAEQRETENLASRARRVTALRQLAVYMKALGKEAYISHDRFSISKSIIHVPTTAELTAFFAVVDTYDILCPVYQHFVLGYRLLFRLYYCCGLRLAEGVNLTKKDVDYTDGTITILQSKGRKDRVVYMADDLREFYCDYLQAMKRLVPDTPWVFPGKDPGSHILKTSVCRKFRELWAKTPYAAGCDRRPTPHSLRHAFVVDKMNEWMLEGKDLRVMVPYLSAYLGHESPEETFYYYHQVIKAFDVIREKDLISPIVIPKVVHYED